jgi:predicted RNase H-like nuclease
VAEVVAVGADGAPGTWACARRHADGSTSLALEPMAAVPRAPVVALDVPIGLLEEQGPRPCDVAARAMLGTRASSVFAPPARPLLALGTYAEMRAALARAGGPSVSAQAAALVPRIAAVDAFVLADPAVHAWLFESHPELVFHRLAGPLPPKRAAAGLVGRLRAVRRAFPDAEERLAGAPAGGALDDWLDAYACLVAAARPAGQLGGERDARGVPMRMRC